MEVKTLMCWMHKTLSATQRGGANNLKNLPKKLLASLVAMLVILMSMPLTAWADGEMTDTDAYANQWARSDIRAWLNGLSKENNKLPLDGSGGSKGEENNKNFLNHFTDAELNLFQAKDVTTTMFNGSSQTDTKSEVTTKDKFWLPSGNLVDGCNHLISASPNYDLSDDYTYKQKVTYGKTDSWKNVLPIPFWGSVFSWLRSPNFSYYFAALQSVRSSNVDSGYVSESCIAACPCAFLTLP